MDLTRETREAATAAPRDSPAAIAAASRNAIQEAKNRKAAARARMAQRCGVRNQGGEGDDAAQAEPAAEPAPDFTAQAEVLLELLSTRYGRTADRARVIEALTASGGAYLAAAHWLGAQGHLRSVS